MRVDGSRPGRCSRDLAPGSSAELSPNGTGPVHRPHRRPGVGAPIAVVGPARDRTRRTRAGSPHGHRRRSRRRRPGGPRAAVPRPPRDLARRPAGPPGRTTAGLASRGHRRSMGDLRTFVADHLATSRPYYVAGVRVDASGSIAATIDAGRAAPRPAAPAAARSSCAQTSTAGCIELGDGILGRSLEHVLERLAARRCVVLTTAAQPRARRGRGDVGPGASPSVPVDVEELPDGAPAKTPRRAGAAVPSARRPPAGAA